MPRNGAVDAPLQEFAAPFVPSAVSRYRATPRVTEGMKRPPATLALVPK
jgi:hypothetical protein